MPSQHTRAVLSVLMAERHRHRAVKNETEESRLINLSKVLKRIQRLPEPKAAELDEDERSFEIVVESGYLLESESNYVKHLACGILVAVSQYLSTSFGEWEGYIGSLFVAVENPSWCCASILEVLCKVLKQVKEDSPPQFCQVFFSSFLQHSSRWDHLDKHSNFLRLLCSLVGQQSVSDGFVSSVATTFPRLISRFHAETVGYYARHKLLMIMWRLSGQSGVDVWPLLQLLHGYYDDVLMAPIVNRKGVENQYLEESPFLWSQSHLRRYAVMILLRVCLGRMKDQKKDGLDEIEKWAEQQMHGLEFSVGFVGLYLQEDDVVFTVLLQVLTMHRLITEWRENGEKERVFLKGWFEMGLNPVRVFHVFLKGVNYDHQVIVDYLISKDSGMSCAEYLLKCLRIVCDSWSVFAGMSFEESTTECSTPLDKASLCLLSLQRSLYNLHRKTLFPYNPQPLLKRLGIFQSRCALLSPTSST